MNAAPVVADLKTSAMIASRMPRNVDTTAASWGLLPKGAATKRDQLAKESPRSRWTTMIRPAFVALKMR